MAAIRYIGNFYQKLMNKHPFRMHIIQTGFLMGVGDLIAQTAIEKTTIHNIDWRRTVCYGAVGCTVVGPGVSTWYSTLDRFFGNKGIKTLLKKVALDQLLFAPAFIPVIITACSLTEGMSLQEIYAKLSKDYVDILLTNYKIWPAVQLVNFYFVPLQYRVVVVQIVAVGWNTYLSYKINEDHPNGSESKKTSRQNS